MAESAALLTPTPGRVHGKAFEHTGHRPFWRRTPYGGGVYWVEHFRACTYCRSIHPLDLLEFLKAGTARLVAATRHGRFDVYMPNPIVGQLVEMGSLPGPVFDSWPQDLVHRLYCHRAAKLPFEPTIGERLNGHFDRPLVEPAPAEIRWPLYENHVHQRQWADLWAAAKTGEDGNAEVPSP